MISAFKTIGLLIVFTVCTSAGFLKSHSLYLHVVKLQETVICFNDLLSRLKYDKAEKSEALNSTFVKSGIMQKQDGKLIAVTSGLYDKDIENLNEFILAFGSGDIKTEENRIRFFIELFTEEKKKAEEILSREGRLYRTAGMCAGAAVCLFLI